MFVSRRSRCSASRRRFARKTAATSLRIAMTHRAPFPEDDPDTDIDAARCAEGEDSGTPAPRPKMRFIHQRRQLNKGDIVQLDCDTQCNFMLLSDPDYIAYQRVRPFRYCGGTFKRFPAQIAVPESGDWNIIIDLAGAKGEIQYNITIVID